MLLTVLVSAVLVGIDQWLKHLVVQFLRPVGQMGIVPGVVELLYVENDGAAFSILAGKQGVLIVITSVVLLFAAYILLFRRPKDRLEYVAILMVFAGGVGNLIDRIANGYVVDYINLVFMRFAVFNFADILVTVGFALLVVAVVRAELRQRKAKKALPTGTPAKQDEAEEPNGAD